MPMLSGSSFWYVWLVHETPAQGFFSSDMVKGRMYEI